METAGVAPASSRCEGEVLLLNYVPTFERVMPVSCAAEIRGNGRKVKGERRPQERGDAAHLFQGLLSTLSPLLLYFSRLWREKIGAAGLAPATSCSRNRRSSLTELCPANGRQVGCAHPLRPAGVT